MANTSPLKQVSAYAISQISLELGIRLERKQIQIGTKERYKIFDGVSADNSVVVKILNHSGKTNGSKRPTGKIRNTYADCYYINLTQAVRKILAFTNKEFYDIFIADSDGLVDGIELMHIDLPEEYKNIVDAVTNEASKEMS